MNCRGQILWIIYTATFQHSDSSLCLEPGKAQSKVSKHESVTQAIHREPTEITNTSWPPSHHCQPPTPNATTDAQSPKTSVSRSTTQNRALRTTHIYDSVKQPHVASLATPSSHSARVQRHRNRASCALSLEAITGIHRRSRHQLSSTSQLHARKPSPQPLFSCSSVAGHCSHLRRTNASEYDQKMLTPGHRDSSGRRDHTPPLVLLHLADHPDPPWHALTISQPRRCQPLTAQLSFVASFSVKLL
ncbi:hypothetical protein I3760_15G054600 [Carya illinoinensis]|nr:hypothetical protein I3760_15G054600 [Carya illinoinensis]KAG2666353.1 hypothetical protein I3760_15G054600 [Carya illinoinensis]